MNVKATLSPDDLARACAEAMWKEDDASKGLGMEIVEIGPGRATLKMTVQGRRWSTASASLMAASSSRLADFDVRLCLQQPQ